MERVTVSPLTAEAVNGPDGSDLESSFMVNTGEGLAWTMDWSPVDPTDGSRELDGSYPTAGVQPFSSSGLELLVFEDALEVPALGDVGAALLALLVAVLGLGARAVRRR